MTDSNTINDNFSDSVYCNSSFNLMQSHHKGICWPATLLNNDSIASVL